MGRSRGPRSRVSRVLSSTQALVSRFFLLSSSLPSCQ